MNVPHTNTASERLRQKIGFAFPAMQRAGARLWTSPHAAALYPAYLVQMHGITRSATPLMEAALDQARVLAPHDPVAAALVPYFEHHAPEEAGHERWLRDDLVALGVDADEALAGMPSARVAEFVGAQYYWIRHHHPVTLLGHMAVVEGHPPRIGLADHLREITGLPREAFRTLARHEQLDADHAQEIYDLIDTLDLTADHETAMGVSALHTIQTGVGVFDEVFSSAAGHASSEVA